MPRTPLYSRLALLTVWLALGLSLVVGPAAAGPSPSTANSYPPERGPGSMVVRGSSTGNSVVLSFDSASDSYVVSDAAGIVPGHDCVAVSATQIRCTRHASTSLPDRFGASLSAGDDGFVIAMTGRGGELNGGIGDDTLRSAGHRNVLFGDEGQDRLRGRGGNDALIGGRGHDSLAAGAGNDRVDARQNDHDRLIDCGPGVDVALLDRTLDPAPRHCETVLYRRHSE